jgi:hypothetical protein
MHFTGDTLKERHTNSGSFFVIKNMLILLQEDGGRVRMEPPGDSAVSRLQRVTFATLLLHIGI